MADYFIFLGIAIIATASPGPAVFLAINNGAKYGHLQAITGIFGNVAAMLTLATVSAAGLGAIILASSTLYTVIKIAGGLYLIYLGIKAWCSNPAKNSVSTGNAKSLTPKKSNLFRESYFVGISNPKAIAFYTALFPQFINLNNPVLPQFALLALTFAMLSFAFLTLYASLGSKLKHHLRRDSVSRWVNRITGGIFVGFGTALILNNRSS